MSAGQPIWELTGAEGKVTTTRLGGYMTATRTLDGQGFLTNLKTMKGSTVMRDMGYKFDAKTGNLTWRTGMVSEKENFLYDKLDRLKSVKEGVALVETMAIEFQPNGNILSKTGLGTYSYDPARVHAVTEVDYNTNLMPSTVQSITYNAFNKADCLKDTVDAIAYQLDIMYGPDEQRWKSVLKRNGSDVKTIIFAGDYEKFIDNGVTKELYYIGANDGLSAIYVKDAIQGGKMYYAHTDHLGSIVSLTDSAGVAVFKATYDAWGKQTVSINTIGFYRGYTGHEHLPEFGLINMNGRMYDPLLGRFLSPDNYVQAADFSQSFNRYSYCINNPLKYTDPSGDLFWIIPNIGWSKDGGLNIGLSFVVGIPGGLSAQAGIGYSFGSNDAYGFAGATAAMNTAYASYSLNSGGSVGYTAGLSSFSGLPISTNFASVGVNYNISHNSGSGNVSAWQIDQNGATFNPSVSAMVFPEQTTNFVRSGKFINNDAMLNNFTDAENYQGALDYFGFKGTYDPDNNLLRGTEPGVTHPTTGEVFYNTTAFKGGFDKLYLTYDHELWHHRRVVPGKYAKSGNTVNQEEYLNYKRNYKRQGLYKKHGFPIEENINGYGSALSMPVEKYMPYSQFENPFWHNIFKIKRLW